MTGVVSAARGAARIDAYRTTGSSPTRGVDVTVALPLLALEHGGCLEKGRLACRITGPEGAPVVAVLGGISAGRDAAQDDAGGGWWSDLAGPGRAVDTTRFRVLGIDWIAGRGGSTTADGLPAGGGDIPLLTPRDQAAALCAALDALGIDRLLACIGSSYGGMVALAVGAAGRARRLVVLGAAHEPHPMATALRSLQRDIVRLGAARGAAREAVALARGLAMTTYRSAREFAGRFAAAPVLGDGATPDFAVTRYLRDRGERFADAFPPASFLCLSQSIDLHRVDPGAIGVPTTLVAFEPDAVTPAWQVRLLATQLAGPWTLRVLRSLYGHDAFLKDTAAIAPILVGALCAGEVAE